MLMRTRLGKYTLLAAFLTLLLATVLLLLTMPVLRPRVLLARHLGGQLGAVPDDLVVAQIRQIGDLGDDATATLVQALRNQRPIVRQAAGAELHSRLDAWAEEPVGESSRKVFRLAGLLSVQVRYLDPAALCTAVDLADRILRWPLDLPAVDRNQVLADCQVVLRQGATSTSDAERAAQPTGDVSGQVRRTTATASGAVDAGPVPDPRGNLDLSLTGEPGGGLPIDPVKLPPFPASLAEPLIPQPMTGGEPELLPPVGKGLPYVLFPENERQDAGDEPLPADPVSPPPRLLDENGSFETSEPEQLPSSALKRLDYELESLSDLDLIQRLSDERPWMGCAVEYQLARRGFSDDDMTLARIMASADPNARYQLVRSMQQESRSPRWLFWLSFDADPSVRREAIAIMATSQDPRLQRRLREMLISEGDPQVREALRQWDRIESRK